MKKIKYIKYFQKTKNIKNIPFIFFNFILVLIDHLWLPIVVDSRQLKSNRHRSKQLHPKLGMYILFTYLFLRLQCYWDRLKEKKAKMLKIMSIHKDVPKHSPFKKNILMYIHRLFIDNQLQFVNYLLISPLLLLQF